jgi:hypothetical protein
MFYHYNTYHKLPLDEDDEEEEQKRYAKYINSAHLGMIKGFIFGAVLDHSVGVAIRNGAIYGLVTPIITSFGM